MTLFAVLALLLASRSTQVLLYVALAVVFLLYVARRRSRKAREGRAKGRAA